MTSTIRCGVRRVKYGYVGYITAFEGARRLWSYATLGDIGGKGARGAVYLSRDDALAYARQLAECEARTHNPQPDIR